MTEIAHLQPRAWLIVCDGLDGQPIHDDFFETREQAEQYLAELIDDIASDPPKQLFPTVRLVTPEGEAELQRKIRDWAEHVVHDVRIIHAYL